MKIFVIDNDVNFLAALQAKFSAIGFSVFTNNGSGSIEEIISKIKEANPDYIILDILLPQANGYDFLSSVKGAHEHISAKIFVYTSLSDNESKTRCQNLGADFYFNKGDITIDGFIAKIKKIAFNLRKVKKSTKPR